MIFAIDGTNWSHVLWHAMRGDHGRIESAFDKRIGLIRATWPESRVVIAFDRSPTFRSDIDPTYKANRPPSDPKLVESLGRIEQRMRDDSGVVVTAEDGFEADDCLATVARIAAEARNRCVIVSPDKDLHQCLDAGRVSILNHWKVDGSRIKPTLRTAQYVQAEFGFGPRCWIDYQTLLGDAGDNIRGCEGIGPKSAAKLIATHGSLDRVLADPFACAVSSRQRDALCAFRERADQVRRLVALCDRVRWIDETIEDCLQVRDRLPIQAPPVKREYRGGECIRRC